MRSELFTLTESLLRGRDDLKIIRSALESPDNSRIDFIGGLSYFDDECIYDPVDDGTARKLLNDWLDGAPDIGWDVRRELSKLLAKRGHLVRERVEPILRDLAALQRDEGGFVPWIQYQLCLSFLWWLADGEALAIHFLDRVPEDFRDGLLRACYKLNTPAVYEAVKASVRRWRAGGWTGDQTCERWFVHLLVQLWDQTFPGGDHDDIRAWTVVEE